MRAPVVSTTTSSISLHGRFLAVLGKIGNEILYFSDGMGLGGGGGGRGGGGWGH